jgi:hypothetical protein
VTGPQPDASAAWISAGVCHEVLLRTLPSLRHDMAGILSVARMDLALLKRWVAKLATQGLDDAAVAGERVQRVDQQFSALLQSLQALQAWGAEEAGDAQGAHELLDACLGWVRPVLMLAKVSTERVPQRDGEAPLVPVSPSAFKYLCLAALWYWVDSRPALARLTVALAAPGELSVAIEEHPGGPPVSAGRAPQPVLGRIDEAALSAVAQQLGWRLELAASRVTLRWA